MNADNEVIDAMEKSDDKFVKALAKAISAGDREERARLQMVFPEYWQHYDAVASGAKAVVTTPKVTIKAIVWGS